MILSNKYPPKMPLSLFSVGHLLPFLKECLLSLVRLQIHMCYHLEIVSGLDQSMCPYLFSALGLHLGLTGTEPTHAAPVSAFMCAFC